MKRMTRRQFVRSGAALAAPMIVSPSVFGTQQKVAPSNRITVGVIGVGKMGMFHVDRFTENKDTQVVAICDINKSRRESAVKVAQQRGTPDATGTADHRQLLDRKDIQAVLIATPDHWHTAIAIEAVKAGKDVYCEKPLTLTIQEAKLLIDAVRKHDRVFQVGSQQRSDGPFRNVCDYIRNGRLGKIKEVHVGVGPTSKWCDLPGQPPDPDLDWDRWLGPAPKREYNEVLCRKGLPNGYPFNPGWRDFREYSGGYVTDWGAHHLDITQWALDMDTSGPVEIHPPADEKEKYGTKLIYRGSPVGEEIAVFHAKMKNGIRFVGEKGEIFVDRGKHVSTPDTILKEPLAESDKRLFKSPGHHKNFIECIRTRQRPLCDVEVGSRSVTVCHLVNLAIWHGRKLTWDPQKWEFPGDDEANKWRERERRDGYPLPTI